MTFVYLLTYRHRDNSWVCGVFETMASAQEQKTSIGHLDIATCAICQDGWGQHRIKEEEVRP